MNIFDIVGPVMVGPSSSHTAGAVRIGSTCKKLMGEKIVKAEILLHGSFLQTGAGHGTDKALVAGLMGFSVDDMRISESFELAGEYGLQFTIGAADLGNVHPNSVKLKLVGESGRKLEIVAASVGGGRIQIRELDGIAVNFSGESPTLIVHNLDQPGHVKEVAGILEQKAVNVATMQLYRKSRGGEAVMVLECDQEIPEDAIRWLENLKGIINVTYLGNK